MTETLTRRFQETLGEFVQRTRDEKINREKLKVFIANQQDMIERMDRLNIRLDKVQAEHNKIRKLLR